MPDRDVAVEALERGLGEDLRDQTHVLVDDGVSSIADRDTCRFLAAVLEGVEPEVGELGDLFTGRPDAEDATGVLGALLARKEVVTEQAITTGHGVILGEPAPP